MTPIVRAPVKAAPSALAYVARQAETGMAEPVAGIKQAAEQT